MSSWLEIRSLATNWHNQLASETTDLLQADILIQRALSDAGLKLLTLSPSSVLLDGAEALFDQDENRILCSEALTGADKHFVLAHEIAHARLHRDAEPCHSDDLDPWTPAEPDQSALGEADAYSPKQRREAQANVYARELLLPRLKLKSRFLEGDTTAAEIAAALQVPESLVLQQLADALLLPADPPRKNRPPEPDPDTSQLEAVIAPIGPHQVRAGPGTGKTRTLVSRIKYLMESGEPATSILALTFSNESAQDLAVRIRASLGEASTGIWTGTFHAFGLELLRLYWNGPNTAPYMASRSDQLFLLEELLPKLSLDYYLDLYEPLRSLKAVLGAISRAKDELCTPNLYRIYAERTAKRDAEAGAKALEVARVYAIYEDEMHERGWIDFGDLIVRSIDLLSLGGPALDWVQSTYRNILVDEYQDTNRASSVLLDKLTQPGRGPWVVGDVRQSIYRFRGASPLNMAKFRQQFNGAGRTDLKVNYRSGGRIVSTFEAFGRSMTVASEEASVPELTPHHGADTGTVAYNVAATREAEFEGIASRIRDLKAAGESYRGHAVLARSHTVLSRLADHFEKTGIPALYFGDFFERPEIRDMLSLLSVVSEGEGIGLFRVGRWPRYAVLPLDLQTVLHWVRDNKTSMLKALRALDLVPGLSEAGRSGLQRLADDVGTVQFTTSPHTFLAEYLFNRGGVLVAAFEGDAIDAQQRRLAIYQLLQITYEHRHRTNADPKRTFLEHIRRLEVLDEEKEFRRLPAVASGIDAVKLMTVHASKGLEFDNVHIPSLSPSYFPPNAKAQPCPPPDGMVEPDPLLSPDMEEKSLFFVALSRARNRLGLSRAKRYGGSSRPNPSSLMTPLLPKFKGPGEPDWLADASGEVIYPPLAGSVDFTQGIDVTAVERYEKCPRRFYYQDVLKLRSRSEGSPYVRFLSVIRSTLKWMNGASQAERAEALETTFERSWTEFGPVDHPHNGVYRDTARQMLSVAAKEMSGALLEASRETLVGARRITLQADNVREEPHQIVVQRLKAGRLAKTERRRTRDKLLHHAVSRGHSKPVVFEHVSLLTGDRTAPVDKVDDKVMGEVGIVFSAIEAGQFEPTPGGRDCPTCPYYFICPSSGAERG